MKTRQVVGHRAIHWLMLCGLAIVGPTSALAQQSGLQIQGVVDVHLNYAKSGDKKLYRVEDGGAAASRLTFRGTEDLGGGLRAGFWLEAGVAPDTGLGTLPGPGLGFTRQSFVHLTSNEWGSIELGRMYTPMFNALLRSDPFNVNTLYSSLNLIAATDSQPNMKAFAARGSNMLRYRGPAQSRLLLDLAYSFGEVPSPHSDNANLIGANLGWKEKVWELSYSFQQSAAGTIAAPVSNPYKSRWHAASGNWAVASDLKLYANYILGSVTAPGTPDAKTLEFAGHWQVAPTSVLIASIAQRKVNQSGNKQMTYTLGYDYALSKRTSLYTRWLQLNNSHRSAVTLANVPVDAGSGNNVSSLALGIRHFF